MADQHHTVRSDGTETHIARWEARIIITTFGRGWWGEDLDEEMESVEEAKRVFEREVKLYEAAAAE